MLTEELSIFWVVIVSVARLIGSAEISHDKTFNISFLKGMKLSRLAGQSGAEWMLRSVT
jgi:hypothetical protein